MDALLASGELNDTFVVFMSDNGYILGEHRIRGGKLAPYEVANRVPLMIRGPGITAGTRIDTAASQVDFAPTVMAMAGLAAPASVDGLSVLNAARNPGTTFNHPPIVIEATNTTAGTDPLPWMYRGVVQDGWKYARPHERRRSTTSPPIPTSCRTSPARRRTRSASSSWRSS